MSLGTSQPISTPGSRAMPSALTWEALLQVPRGLSSSLSLPTTRLSPAAVTKSICPHNTAKFMFSCTCRGGLSLYSENGHLPVIA